MSTNVEINLKDDKLTINPEEDIFVTGIEEELIKSIFTNNSTSCGGYSRAITTLENLFTDLKAQDKNTTLEFFYDEDTGITPVQVTIEWRKESGRFWIDTDLGDNHHLKTGFLTDYITSQNKEEREDGNILDSDVKISPGFLEEVISEILKKQVYYITLF